jgi:hypothetical protein
LVFAARISDVIMPSEASRMQRPPLDPRAFRIAHFQNDKL